MSRLAPATCQVALPAALRAAPIEHTRYVSLHESISRCLCAAVDSTAVEAGAARVALGALMVHVDERYDNNGRNNSRHCRRSQPCIRAHRHYVAFHV